MRFGSKKNVNALLVIYVCQKRDEEIAFEEDIKKQSKGVTDKKKLGMIKDQCEKKMLENSNLDKIYEEIKQVDQKLDKTHLELESIQREWRALKYLKDPKKKVELRKFMEEKCLAIYFYEEKFLSPYLHDVWWILLEILLMLSEFDDTGIEVSLAKKITQELVHLYPQRALGWIRIISFQFKEQCIEKIVDLVAPRDNDNEELEEKEENESNDMILQAIKILNDNLLSFPDSFEGWATLCAMHLSRLDETIPSTSKIFKHHVSYAQQCSEKALSLISEKESNYSCKINKLRREMLLVEAGCKIKLKNLRGCIETFERILEIEKNDSNALKALSILYIQTKSDNEKACDYLENLLKVSKTDKQIEWASSQLGMVLFFIFYFIFMFTFFIFYFLFFIFYFIFFFTFFFLNQVKCWKKEYDEAEKLLLKAIKLDHKNFFSFHWLGRLYWEKGGKFREQKEFAKMNFLNSAKLNPLFANNYTYLGFIFIQIEKDEERGIKCLEKAISLDILDNEAGHALSDIYLHKEKVINAYKLHKKIVNTNTNIHWASLRLALYQFEKEKYADAVTNFQRALRVVPDDIDTWIGLGNFFHQFLIVNFHF